jgi:hypothetical protein
MTARPLFIAALFSCAGLSCGSAPHEAGSQAVPSDGVSGFGRSAPIELCLGSARVVSPAVAASGALAVCVSEGAVPRACSADSECAGIERCMCGRCIVEACQGAASCRGSEVCRGRRCTTACSQDTDCAAGERCVTGGCARPCNNDGNCQFGERCDSLEDSCVTALCSDAAPCGSARRCEPQQTIGEIHEPDVISVSGTPVAFLEIRTGIESFIYRARIDAPQRWTVDPVTPVLALPGETRFGAPSAIVRGSRIDLFAAAADSASILHASSTDGGKTFTVESDSWLVPEQAWEGGVVSSPSAFDFNGVAYVFYEGGPRAGIGLAQVTEAGGLRVGQGPIVTPGSVDDPIFWRGVTEVGAPHALVVDGAVRLSFTARGAEGGDAMTKDGPLPADRNDSIGLATSRDLASFSYYPTGPIFARIANLRTYLGEREAVIRLLPAGAEIVFVASDASGQNVSGLARAGSQDQP